MQIEELFASILREPVEAINDETSPTTTTSWDSLKHLEIVLAIEGAYSVKFTMPEIMSIQSVGAVRKTLQAKGVTV